MAGVGGVSVVAVVTSTTRSPKKSTPTKPKGKATTTAKGSGRSSSARSGSKAKPTTSNRRREKPSGTRPARDQAHTQRGRLAVTPSAGRVLRGHRRDIWGVALVALGLVSALGIYVNAAGPVGNGLAEFFGAFVGLIRVAMPVLFVALGLLMIRGHRRSGRTAPARVATETHSSEEILEPADAPAVSAKKISPEEVTTRVAIGGLLLLVSSTALLHLSSGRPAIGDPTQAFIDAGGYLGWLLGAPLRSAFGAWGAPVVLVAILIIGLVVLTALSLGHLYDRGARQAGAVGGGLNRLWCMLVGVDPATGLPKASTANSEVPIDHGPIVDPTAPIMAGGEQVGQYRRGQAEPHRSPGRNERVGLDLPVGHVGVGDPLLENIPAPESRSFHSLARATTMSTGEVAAATAPTVDARTPKQNPRPTTGAADVHASGVAAGRNGARSASSETAPPEPTRVEGAVPEAKQRAKPKVVVAESGASKRKNSRVRPSVADSPWKLPSLKLLNSSGARSVDQKAVAASGERLEKALASHGVDAHLVGMVVGPTVTRFELELGEGVKVSKITSLNRDIAYAMASADVRILAPIPGRQAIGIEVPNTDRQIVALGDLLRSEQAAKAEHPLEVAVGRDIQGKATLMNLAKMPHLLIAGATGSGKSSCINSIITSVLMRSTPAEVRMILVDPKMVEMTQYENVPHLLTQPVTDPRKAANALSWACREMDRRYQLLAGKGFRDIAGFNKAFDRGDFDAENAEIDAEAVPEEGEPRRKISRLPFILVVVDELADLMMVAARDVEDSICRIAQKARAVGIHLVIATQRPSTNVITGIIKANVPARLAFSVSSLTDSRVILDQGGAERLIGQGDMLMLSPSSSAADRIQGCWVEEDEVRKVVGNWRDQAAKFDLDELSAQDEIIEASPAGASGSSGSGSDGAGSDDELYVQARDLVVTSQLGSTSMLQRKLKVGFARAGRLMDLLEENGVVGPSVGSKAREVLISEHED